ncbi:Maf family protein [Rhodobacteraceae bacterium XHP0102]|nr:Maf family protein [Rhodobacteraceae bacterium XHP0102]
MKKIILASQSQTRQTLLRNASVSFEAVNARIDEEALKQSLRAANLAPRDMVDQLAEAKAAKIARKFPEAVVLGCDQILEFEGHISSKPQNRDQARDQLIRLRGGSHKLLSAVVIYDECEPIWRHVGVVRLHMATFTDTYLDDYLSRNWPAIQSSVGGYMLESEGIRLFSRIEGSYFDVLGFPLIEVLNYLSLRGFIDR